MLVFSQLFRTNSILPDRGVTSISAVALEEGGTVSPNKRLRISNDSVTDVVGFRLIVILDITPQMSVGNIFLGLTIENRSCFMSS